MLRFLGMFFIIVLLMACDNNALKKSNIISKMKGVADYELAHPSVHDFNLEHDFKNGWIPATFYVGLIPLYEATNDPKYLNAVKNWGDNVSWECAPRLMHADDIACGQAYLDLYKHQKEMVYIENLKERMDSIVQIGGVGRNVWSWCDALFMAPPVFVMGARLLQDDKYFQYADSLYWDVYDYLYDQEEALFYRDKRFFTKKSPNGTKVFWGRGNGWVIGGLARLIPYVMDSKAKKKYVTLFQQMSSTVAKLQQKDGMWRSNLLDQSEYPIKESSASSFYVYSLAWGINNGYLDCDYYEPIVIKGWKALVDCVDKKTGKLGYVQPIGAAPDQVSSQTTMSYGAGAFLLAGTEILKLIENKEGMAKLGDD